MKNIVFITKSSPSISPFILVIIISAVVVIGIAICIVIVFAIKKK